MTFFAPIWRRTYFSELSSKSGFWCSFHLFVNICPAQTLPSFHLPLQNDQKHVLGKHENPKKNTLFSTKTQNRIFLGVFLFFGIYAYRASNTKTRPKPVLRKSERPRDLQKKHENSRFC